MTGSSRSPLHISSVIHLLFIRVQADLPIRTQYEADDDSKNNQNEYRSDIQPDSVDPDKTDCTCKYQIKCCWNQKFGNNGSFFTNHPDSSTCSNDIMHTDHVTCSTADSLQRDDDERACINLICNTELEQSEHHVADRVTSCSKGTHGTDGRRNQ